MICNVTRIQLNHDKTNFKNFVHLIIHWFLFLTYNVNNKRNELSGIL